MLTAWKVFEDDDDIDSAADKTVTLSIADGKPYRHNDLTVVSC